MSQTECRGEALAGAINGFIDMAIQENEDINTIQEVMELMAEQAGIDANTVENIRLPSDNPDITCPPLVRLEGFANAFSELLNESEESILSDLINAGNADGCEYEIEENSKNKGWPRPQLANRDTVDGTERRSYPLVEVRADTDEDTIEGMAAVFDKPTTINSPFGQHKEVIRQGAFKPVLEENPDTRMLLNHDPNFVFGRTKAGTLELEERSTGLHIRNEPPETQWAKDNLVSMERGDIDQMSFGFRVEDNGQNWLDGDDMPVREINEFSAVPDVSVVTYPAYSETQVGVRSQLQQVKQRMDIDFMRVVEAVTRCEAGNSRESDERILRMAQEKFSELLNQKTMDLELKKREMELAELRI